MESLISLVSDLCLKQPTSVSDFHSASLRCSRRGARPRGTHEDTHDADEPGQGGCGGGVVHVVVEGRALLVVPRLVALCVEHGPLGVQGADGLCEGKGAFVNTAVSDAALTLYPESMHCYFMLATEQQ